MSKIRNTTESTKENSMKWIMIFIIFTCLGPLWVLFRDKIDLSADWRTANRKSAHLASDPKTTPEAIIQVYSAPAFNWRGLVSVHLWIAVKPKNAEQYRVYQVIGWRSYQGLPPLMDEIDIPDRYWFNQKPKVVFDLRGASAEKLIPQIEAATQSYPYTGYAAWPGPNSNTLPAYIARCIPELGLALPPNAIGKDFQPLTHLFSKAPSGTGYQISLFGILGIMLAKKEGLEINILGLVYGINPSKFAIILPGIGEISLSNEKGKRQSAI
jgi:hypothetical protein